MHATEGTELEAKDNYQSGHCLKRSSCIIENKRLESVSPMAELTPPASCSDDTTPPNRHESQYVREPMTLVWIRMEKNVAIQGDIYKKISLVKGHMLGAITTRGLGPGPD